MGQQNSRDLNRNYSLQFLEKHIISPAFNNGSRCTSNTPDYFVGDTVILVPQNGEDGGPSSQENQLSSVPNSNKGESNQAVKASNNENVVQIEIPKKDLQKSDRTTDSQNNTEGYVFVTHSKNLPQTIGLMEELSKDESEDENCNNVSVYEVEAVNLDPNHPNRYTLKLTGLNEIVTSDQVLLLSSQQNKIRHQYNWLAFLYMDLCHSLSQMTEISPENVQSGDPKKRMNAAEQLQSSVDVLPDRYFVDALRKHAKDGIPIHSLSFSNQSITDFDALPILFIIRRIRHLARLELKNCQISWKFCQNFSECFKNTMPQSNLQIFLSELDLSFNNQIKLEGAKYIAEALNSKNCSLHLLNMEQTEITSEGCVLILNAILENPNSVIVKLNLRQCGVSDEQIRLALEVARTHPMFCFFDAYPHIRQGLSSTSSVSWLSMTGWNNFSSLRETLLSNIERVKHQPELLLPKIVDEESTINFNQFLGFKCQSYLSKLFYGLKQEDSSYPSSISQMHSVESHSDLNSDAPLSSTLDSSNYYDNDQTSYFDEDIMKLRVLSLSDTPSQRAELTIQCKICFEDVPLKDVYIIDGCEHKFCLSCLHQYLSSKINSFETDTIRCPECNRNMEQSEIKQIIELLTNERDDSEDNLFEKYTEFSLKKALMQMKGLIWCPNPECDNAMVFNGPSESDSNSSHGNVLRQNLQVEPTSHIHTKNCVAHEINLRDLQNVTINNDKVSDRILSRYYPHLKGHTYNQGIDTSHRRSQSEQFAHSIPSHGNSVQSISSQNQLSSNERNSVSHLNLELMQPAVQKVSKKLLHKFYGSIIHDQDLYGEEYGKKLLGSYLDIPQLNNGLNAHNMTEFVNNTPMSSSSSTSEMDKAMPIKEYSSFRVKCSECETEICGLCKLFYHPGVTCEKFKISHEAVDESFDGWKKKQNAKECPQCKCLIEKNGGCNHMTCKHCNTEFCWICGKILVGKEIKNHFGLYFGCRKWSMDSIFS